MKIKRFYHLAAFSILLWSSIQACELWAVVVSSPGISLAQDSLLISEELNFFRSETEGNYLNDGWAMLYYRQGQVFPDTTSQLWRSPIPACNDTLFDQAVSAVLASDNFTQMAQAHIRNASSGAVEIPDPHPFLYQWNDQLLSFSHNGSLDKTELLELLTDFGADSSWILAHPPDTYGCGDWQAEGWDCVIDSQLYFYWLIRNIEISGDMLTGIENALTIVEDPVNSGSYLSGAKNFTLLDGESLYAYRSAQSYNSHKLYYSDASVLLEGPWSGIQQQHLAVMTKPPASGPAAAMNWIWMENGTLIRLRPGEAPLIITGLANDFLPGDMNQDAAVDILDVIWLVFMIIDEELPSDYELMAGDMNLDGELNVADVTWLVNIILYF